MKFISVICLGVMALALNAHAVTYRVPDDGGRLVGELKIVKVPRGNVSLESIAADYQMGFSNMLEANPRVDPYSPLPGTNVVIPQKLILPDTVHEGIIINSPEMRLYYYHDGYVDVLPIGIGQLGKDTPAGWVTKVERKKDGPTWTPTAATRKEYADKGEPLPAVVPAGPDNPMGLYALYVGRLFAIHGTNANFGIGLRVSHGCVRLRDPDIKYLFENVPVGTRVEFINEPVKVTREPDGGVYAEIHQPLSTTFEQINSDNYSPIHLSQKIRAFFQENEVDTAILDQEFNERSGIPVMLNPVDF
ncbi:MAG: L,D-transpeptidase family protein [Succinimonas sp.]|nr:L,D-transpeptidase family protein [Succinimonas sp.]MEE3421166.1 L,D-transpeptidase family protein [Succinimonas sp.]